MTRKGVNTSRKKRADSNFKYELHVRYFCRIVGDSSGDNNWLYTMTSSSAAHHGGRRGAGRSKQRMGGIGNVTVTIVELVGDRRTTVQKEVGPTHTIHSLTHMILH